MAVKQVMGCLANQLYLAVTEYLAGRRDATTPPRPVKHAMYQALSEFLKSFSADFPILWALLVMVVIGGTGLTLYAFWEAVLKGLAAVFGKGSDTTENTSH